MSDPRLPLLIVGASTRAAAHSALRGGWQPTWVDLYGDVDLVSVAQGVAAPDFPEGVVEGAAALSPAPWMYTGGMENHPQLVDQLSRGRPLWGNPGDVLQRIRDPWWIAAQLRQVGLPVLDLWPAAVAPPPADGSWLQKPLCGSGGRGISRWDESATPLDETVYYQRRVEGKAYAAHFLALPDQVLFLGGMRQLIGLSRVAAPPFAWCGALSPAELDTGTLELMRSIGERLAREGPLLGLFGCDFIVDGEGTPWLTEVNPRYTGAMELLDHRWSVSLVGCQAQACRGDLSDASLDPGEEREASAGPLGRLISRLSVAGVQHRDRVLGKIVLFAERELWAHDARNLLLDPLDDRFPFVADLPAPGQKIAAGHPVCSLFAYDRTEALCLPRLVRCARMFRRRLSTAAPDA
ncbi:MAG: ATP-grasp domain-containing protein [Planctomycetales bacterium]